jgi:aspartate aminotransferase-like enzyme
MIPGMVGQQEVVTTLKAIETSLIKQGFKVDRGACLKTALETL